MNEYECNHVYDDHESDKWSAFWEITDVGVTGVEMLICGRSSAFKVIVGNCGSGNYLCIPSLDVGCGLADLTDVFWNRSKLARVMGSDVDAVTISLALCNYKMKRKEAEG
ncbi:MAG: hypothetical protein IKE58_02600 [Blautia sp.]|nr:hypothetical protein [Blautia sp.]